MGTSVLGTNPAASIYPSWYQQPQLVVTINGSNVPHILNATITYGLDIGTSEATIEMTEVPIINDYSKFSTVQVFCSAGNLTQVGGPPLRFTGVYLRTEATLDPHIWRMRCKGNLYRAELYRQASFIQPYPYGSAGMTPAFLNQLGIPVGLYPWANTGFTSKLRADVQALVQFLINASTAPTDQQYVLAALQRVPGLVVNGADIGGTGKQFGILSYLDLVWPPYRSALEQVHQLDAVCLGYRTFESLGGRIVRSQIFGYPSSVADTTFTEGIDIWSGQGSRSVEQLINGTFVEGSQSPIVSAGMLFDYIQQSNPFEPSSNPVIEQFQSPLIDTSSVTSSAGINVNSLSTYDVALWRLSERNRELVNYSLVTFRDDLLFPGRSIALNTPHMAITEPVWMQRVEVRVSADPVLFQQTIYGLGGGLPTGYPSAPDYTPPLDPGNGFQ
jgi:hypothetical protein